MFRFISFWRNLLLRRRVERQLDDELQATVGMLVDERVAAGMSLEQARRAARLELGTAESIKEHVRDIRAGAFLDTLLQDGRYGVRLLRRNPLFALTAILSLAIGIGATTTIFTVANGLLLRSAVGVADPSRLVDIVRLEVGDFGVEAVSYPDYLDVRRRATTVQDVYGYHLELEPVSLRADDSAERAFANVVTMNFFQALGVPAATGRTFGDGDSEQPGASPVTVLSHRFWTRRFAGDPAVVGRTVRLNGHPFTVVGVAREGFRGMSVLAPDLWIPAGMVGVAQAESAAFRLTVRENGWLLVGGRLKPGISRAQASDEMAAIGASLAREFPFDPQFLPRGMPPKRIAWSAEIASPIPVGLRTPVAAFFVLLMAIVSIMLLIACANVAGILLTRATVRRREIAVRAAIGAARARVVRQLLTETMVLFVLGGAAGLAVARLLTTALVALLPSFPVPVNVSVPLDARVMAFSLALALVSAVLAGLAPAFHAARTDVVSALKDDAQAPAHRIGLRNAFVVAQVTLSTLLMVVAGVLANGLDRVTAIDRGFDASGVDVASVDLSMAGYTAASGPPFARDLVERVRALPGVTSATLADRAPGPGSMSFGGVTVPGVTPPAGATSFTLSWTLVDSGYFSTLRIPLLAGRDFGPQDDAAGDRVAILGEAAARRFWPDGSAVGQLIVVTTAAMDGSRQSTPVRVVGVAKDVGGGGRRGEVPLALYVPLQQRYVPQVTVLARRDGASSLAGDLHVLITSSDPNLPVLNAQTLESQQNGPVEMQLRISAAVAGSVGLVGLLLAAIGIYGVTAYTVARRTREIGIRLSLGATRWTVVGLVLVQGMRLVAMGSIAGVALGMAAGRLLSASPLRVPPPGALLLTAAALLFAAIGLVACYVPVRRVTRIRAMEALRYE
jgi:putative ABC transport system permease protein